MSRRIPLLALVAVGAVVVAGAAGTRRTAPSSPPAPPPPPTPAEGYNIHVLAPHVVEGQVSGPYHHYCKVLASDPQIVCLIYTSTDSAAMLEQIEFIMAKSLTRSRTPRRAWNGRWHDHAVEIAGGRVQVLDMPADQAQQVANLVSTTDGLIVHFHFNNGLPTGRTSIAQAVGHRRLALQEWNRQKAALAK